MKFWTRSLQILSILLTALLSFPLFAKEPLSNLETSVTLPSHLPRPGKQVYKEVETAYLRGGYDKFLSNLHEQYEKAGEAGLLRKIFETLQTVMQENSTDKEVLQKQKEQIALLEKERNRRLLEAAEVDPNALIAKTIDAVVFYFLAPQLKNVLAEFSSLKYDLPETDRGTITNKISALETEYMIKAHLLNLANYYSGSSADELEKKKMALTLEKFDKMRDATRELHDLVWEEKVATAKLAYRIQSAFEWDFRILQLIGQGKLEPKNTVEEKVRQIMIDFLQEVRTF